MNGGTVASLSPAVAGRSVLSGALSFSSVGQLLRQGESAISSGEVATIDLASVTGTDSAGLSLLIEWLSVARAAGKPLAYINVPAQLLQLARMGDVEDLLTAA